MDVSTKLYADLSSKCWYISVQNKVADQLTNTAIPRATQLASLNSHKKKTATHADFFCIFLNLHFSSVRVTSPVMPNSWASLDAHYRYLPVTSLQCKDVIVIHRNCFNVFSKPTQGHQPHTELELYPWLSEEWCQWKDNFHSRTKHSLY